MKFLTTTLLAVFLMSGNLASAHTLTTERTGCHDDSWAWSKTVAKSKAKREAKKAAEIEAKVVCEGRLHLAIPYKFSVDTQCVETPSPIGSLLETCSKCTATAFFACSKL